jgi:WD40 repeat protein
MIEAALDPKLLNTLKGHKDQITSVHFHPHGYIIVKNIVNKLYQVLMIVWYLYGI